MTSQIDLPFNPKKPKILHIDLNSCFATIEQQANPLLRNKPVAVAAYTTPKACIIAPSIEAKKLGISVGMRVQDGKQICPELIVLEPDPKKYREIHISLSKILNEYTDKVVPKSIDEFILDFDGSPSCKKGIEVVAQEMKQRIKKEVGDYLTVSIGIAPNRLLAKTAAGLHKPDGLDVIDITNFVEIYKNLKLTDFPGISTNNEIRLNKIGIFNVMDFYRASVQKSKTAFKSILSYYWYLRLHGWEIDDVEFSRKSYGNSHALGVPLTTHEEIAPLLMNLVDKAGTRMRKAGYEARGVHLSIVFRDFDYWHRGVTIPDYIFDSRDIYKFAYKILKHCPYIKPVRELAVSVFELRKVLHDQLSFFEDVTRKRSLVKAIDEVNKRWGDRVITPGLMLSAKKTVLDRIAFGGIKELEDTIIR